MPFRAVSKLGKIGRQLIVVPRRHRREGFSAYLPGFHAHNVEIKGGMCTRREPESRDLRGQ